MEQAEQQTEKFVQVKIHVKAGEKSEQIGPVLFLAEEYDRLKQDFVSYMGEGKIRGGAYLAGNEQNRRYVLLCFDDVIMIG